jgi:hypothetical protein
MLTPRNKRQVCHSLMTVMILMAGCGQNAVAPSRQPSHNLNPTIESSEPTPNIPVKPLQHAPTVASPRLSSEPIRPPSSAPHCEIDFDQEQPVVVSEVTLLMRPQFYEGSMPLVFKSIKKPEIGMGMGSATLIQEFDDWITFFGYADPSFEFSGIASCARTFNKSGEILAEAQAEDIGNASSITIVEVHYNSDGSPRFWSRSEFDQRGQKTGEVEAHGHKERDYYFIWPALGL